MSYGTEELELQHNITHTGYANQHLVVGIGSILGKISVGWYCSLLMGGWAKDVECWWRTTTELLHTTWDLTNYCSFLEPIRVRTQHIRSPLAVMIYEANIQSFHRS